jgi:hypothetical protein
MLIYSFERRLNCQVGSSPFFFLQEEVITKKLDLNFTLALVQYVNAPTRLPPPGPSPNAQLRFTVKIRLFDFRAGEGALGFKIKGDFDAIGVDLISPKCRESTRPKI